jgi:assimilatory nitrate reductase catalytic subunit
VAEPRVARYPFALTTGRLRDQWHGMSRTGTIGRLFGHVPEPVLDMHPQDMDRRGLRPGQLVRVSSTRGSVVIPVHASDQVGLGQLFMAMHWGSEVLGGQDTDGRPLTGVNALTTPATCPTSRQPEFKHCAVRIDKVDLPWSLVAMAWLPPDQAHTVRQQLASDLHQYGYAVCVPFGREHTGVLFRAASAQPAGAEALQRLEGLLGLQSPDTLRYRDARNGQHRAVRFLPPEATSPSQTAAADRQLAAVLLAGDTQSAAWIQPLLQQRQPAGALGRALLQATATSPTPHANAAGSAQVCACLNVRESAITQCLATCTGDDAQRLQQLQAQLACGTQCGSCVPTLKTLVRQTPATAPLAGTPLAI